MADTFAATYVAATSIKAGEAAAKLAAIKREKYVELTHTHLFCPIAVETMSPVEEEGRYFAAFRGTFPRPCSDF